MGRLLQQLPHYNDENQRGLYKVLYNGAIVKQFELL